MEGTIKIEAIPNLGFSVEADVRNVSRLDVLGVLDALAAGLKLDEEERKILGITFAAGGLSAVNGVKSMSLELDKGLFEMLKKKGKENNETDAH
jgi:hypothetical protein